MLQEPLPKQQADKKQAIYARYVLFVLLLVYIMNFIDRQILAILAEEIKADLNITDADLGFLVGTAFSVFYSTFGIAFGRLADVWNRKKLITTGLSFWSLMTCLSGFSKSFTPLVACRFGVAVGEATATPAAFSILYDYFSPKVRTTVLAIYDSGIYIGAGLGLFIGGTVLDFWTGLYPDSATAPLGLKSWQAAFIIVGLPGVLLALWVSTLREPVRGQQEGITSQIDTKPLKEALTVLVSMVPLVNLLVLSRYQKIQKALMINITIGVLISALAYGFIKATGSVAQWSAMGIGLYAVSSWAQALAGRDPVIFAMIFHCKTLRFLALGGAMPLFSAVAIGFWSIPYFQRQYGVSVADIGAVLGLGNAVVGFIGVLVGGVLADKLRTRTSRGKLYVVWGSIFTGSIASLVLLNTNSLTVAYGAALASTFVGAMGFPTGSSSVNDLMLPRGRATASALFLMVKVFLGGALGPYLIGYLSDAFMASGIENGEALREAMLWSLIMPTLGLVLLWQAIRHVEQDENNIISRARALGEPI